MAAKPGGGAARLKAVEPPELSARALRESRPELDDFNKRFIDTNQPDEFRNKFLDVNLTIRMLTRSQNRLYLRCELLAYTILVTMYCIYLFDALPSGYALVRGVINQAMIIPVFQSSVPVFIQLGNKTYDWCDLPFISAAESFHKHPEPPPANGTSWVPCVLVEKSMDFQSITTVYELSEYIRTVFIGDESFGSALFPLITPENANKWIYSVDPTLLGFPPNYMSPFMITRVMPTGGWVPVGAVQFRQVRVKTKLCAGAEGSIINVGKDGMSPANAGRMCPMPLSRTTEDTESFTRNNKTYNWTSPEQLARVTLPAINGESGYPPLPEVPLYTSATVDASKTWERLRLGDYPQGGFVVNIENGNLTAANEVYQELFDSLWVDEKTALFTASFTMFSSNTNLLLAVRLVVEFSAYGLVVPSFETTLVPITISETPDASGQGFGLGVTLLVFSSILLLYFLYNIARSLRYTSVYNSIFGWTMYDIVNLAIVISSVVLSMDISFTAADTAASTTQVLLRLMSGERDVFPSIYFQLARQAIYARALGSFSILVCFFKFFKYIDMNKRFSLALSMLRASRHWLMGWTVIATVIILAFSVYVFYAFGHTAYTFSTYGKSLTSVLLFTVQVLGGISSNEAISVPTNVDDVLSGGMSYLLYGIHDGENTPIGSAALTFVFVFVLLVFVVVGSLFYAILIQGYQKVIVEVAEDEDLRKEQRELLARSRQSSQQGVVLRFCKGLRSSTRTRETQKIIARLKTAPETQYRSLLAYAEVLEIVREVVGHTPHAEALTNELMILYQTPLTRIKDAFALFKDNTINHAEGRRGAGLDQSELPLVSTNTKNGIEVTFDPSARENWIKDMVSGNVLQSLFFVHCLQVEQSTHELDDQLRSIDLTQRQIQLEQMQLETCIQAMEKWARDHNGDVVPASDPWAARQSSCIEPQIDGGFQAHHVEQQSGAHRYLGWFATRQEAQSKIDETNTQFLQQRKHEEIRSEEKAPLGNIFGALGASSRIKSNQQRARERGYDDDEQRTRLSEVTSVLSDQSDFDESDAEASDSEQALINR